MTYAQVQKADAERMAVIRKCYPNARIKIVEMCIFDKKYTSSKGEKHEMYLQFLQDKPTYKVDNRKRTEKEILNEIAQGTIFGFIQADFTISDELKALTEQFPLFMKKGNVSINDVGAGMKKYLQAAGKMEHEQMELFPSHFAREHLVSTDLCAFYLKMGVSVERIKCVIEYQCTEKLGDLVQRACDLRFSSSSKHEKTLAALAKACVVSSYGMLCTHFPQGGVHKNEAEPCLGRMILNPASQTKTKYVNDESLLKLVYRGDFSRIDYVGMVDGQQYYEIKSKKRVLHYRYPYSMGTFILSASKLRMLELVYQMIIPHFKPETYSFFATQTGTT